MSAPGDQFLRAESAGTQGTRKRKAPPEEEPADDDGSAPVTTTPRPGDPPLSDAELEAAAQRVAIVLSEIDAARNRWADDVHSDHDGKGDEHTDDAKHETLALTATGSRTTLGRRCRWRSRCSGWRGWLILRI